MAIVEFDEATGVRPQQAKAAPAGSGPIVEFDEAVGAPPAFEQEALAGPSKLEATMEAGKTLARGTAAAVDMSAGILGMAAGVGVDVGRRLYGLVTGESHKEQGVAAAKLQEALIPEALVQPVQYLMKRFGGQEAYDQSIVTKTLDSMASGIEKRTGGSVTAEDAKSVFNVVMLGLIHRGNTELTKAVLEKAKPTGAAARATYAEAPEEVRVRPGEVGDLAAAEEARPQSSITFVRHGETKLNEEGKLRGWSDSEDAQLSPEGVAKAEKAADELKDTTATAIYTSDLGRAVDTAEAISRKTGLPVIKDPALRPLDVGNYTEMPAKKVEKTMKDHLKAPEVPIDGGESINQYAERLISRVEEIEKETPHALITGHLRTDRMLAAWDAKGRPSVAEWNEAGRPRNFLFDEKVFKDFPSAPPPGGISRFGPRTTPITEAELGVVTPKDVKAIFDRAKKGGDVGDADLQVVKDFFAKAKQQRGAIDPDLFRILKGFGAGAGVAALGVGAYKIYQAWQEHKKEIEDLRKENLRLKKEAEPPTITPETPKPLITAGLTGLAALALTKGRVLPEMMPGKWFAGENVTGKPEYGMRLNNPIHLKDGTRLSGFTSPEQTVFRGYDKNGEPVSIRTELVNPEDITWSKDSNKTAQKIAENLKALKGEELPAEKATPVTPEAGSADIKTLAAVAMGVTLGAWAADPNDKIPGAFAGAALGAVLSSGLIRNATASLYKAVQERSPTARATERVLANTIAQAQRTFNPDLLGKKAEQSAAILASNMSKQAQLSLERGAASAERAQFWAGRQSVHKAFLGMLEQGKKFADPQLQAYATFFRDKMDRAYLADQLKGITYEPVDNYVYHLFEDPKGASAYLTNKYGAKWGNPRFAHNRSAELIADAERAGWKLKTTNPEDILQARLQASDIAHMKIDALRQLAEYDLARPVKKGMKAAADETTWRAPNGELYFLGPEANQVFHNAFNTTSLWAEPGAAGAIYRGAMYLKNAIVPIKLMSLFHPLHVQLGMSFADPLVSMTKRFAGGTAEFSDIIKEGLKKLALTDIYTTPKSGWEMMKAFRGEIPEAKLTAAQKAGLQDMTEGGYIPELSTEFRNRHMRDFKEAIAAHSAKAAWHLPFAIMEKFYTKPIFEQWIPAVKTAAYLRATDAAKAANPALLTDPIARMTEFRKIQKMVDDRFGEMQYKTLFMNRLVKDVAVGSFLSYGWQLGFIRSYVGAVPEAARAVVSETPFRQKIARGELDKAMFVGYYAMGTMFYGGLLTYALTGDLPKSLLDYIYPRSGEQTADGKEARLSTPFYTREFVSIPKHVREGGIFGGLGTVIANKLSPAVGVMKALATNSDFLNREISDPNAPILQRTGQIMKHLFGEMEPISTSAAKREGASTTKSLALSISGFTPAPRYVTEGETEGRIRETFMKYQGGLKAYMTPEQIAEKRAKAKPGDSYAKMFKALPVLQQAHLLHAMPSEDRSKYYDLASQRVRDLYDGTPQ